MRENANMKPVFLALILCLLTTIQAEAQELHKYLRIGITNSALEAEVQNFDTDDYIVYGRVGFAGGVDVSRQQDALFVMVGLHYHAVSNRLERIQDFSQDQITRKSVVQMLKMPITVGADLTQNSSFMHLTFRGGLVTSYVFAVGEEVNFNFEESNFNEIHFGGMLGLGIDVDFISVDLTHEWGFTNMINDVDSKNRMISLTAGLKF